MHSIEYPHQAKSNQLTSHHFPKHLWCFHCTVHNRIFTARFIASDWNLWQWSSDCTAITLQMLFINAPYHRKHFINAVLEKLRWYQIMFPTVSCTCCSAQNHLEPGKQQLVLLITVNPADLWFSSQNFCSGTKQSIEASVWGFQQECCPGICVLLIQALAQHINICKTIWQAISISTAVLLHSIYRRTSQTTILSSSRNNHVDLAWCSTVRASVCTAKAFSSGQ